MSEMSGGHFYQSCCLDTQNGFLFHHRLCWLIACHDLRMNAGGCRPNRLFVCCSMLFINVSCLSMSALFFSFGSIKQWLGTDVVQPMFFFQCSSSERPSLYTKEQNDDEMWVIYTLGQPACSFEKKKKKSLNKFPRIWLLSEYYHLTQFPF